MHLPEFEYFEPETIQEACSLLLKYKGGARVLAGGTDLHVHMKNRVLTPRVLVNLKRIPDLNHVSYDEKEGLRIGALTTVHAVGTSPVVKGRFPMLAQACNCVGTPQIRNVATMGGNLCLDSRCFYYNRSQSWRLARSACYHTGGHACHVVKGSERCHALFVADTVPALIALGARVTIVQLDGDKQIPLEEFYTQRGEEVTSLQPGQIIIEIQVPVQSSNTCGVYLKFAMRHAIDFAIVGVAGVITLAHDNGVCLDAKIVVVGVASGPVRAVEAEEVIKGRKMDDKTVEDVGKAIFKEIRPLTHMGIPANYRRRLIETLTKRAVRQAWQQVRLI